MLASEPCSIVRVGPRGGNDGCREWCGDSLPFFAALSLKLALTDVPDFCYRRVRHPHRLRGEIANGIQGQEVSREVWQQACFIAKREQEENEQAVER
jgi:hypothetical protein